MEQTEIKLRKLTEQVWDDGYHLTTLTRYLAEKYAASVHGEVLNINNELCDSYFIINATNIESDESMWGKLFALQTNDEWAIFTEIELGYDFKKLTSISDNDATLQGVLNDASVIKVVYDTNKAQFEAEDYGK